MTNHRCWSQPNASWRDFGSCGRSIKRRGYTLEVKEFTDYVQPNLTLENKELDANFFQHLPYLEDFNVKNNTKLVSAGVVHYEPLAYTQEKLRPWMQLPMARPLPFPMIPPMKPGRCYCWKPLVWSRLIRRPAWKQHQKMSSKILKYRL